MTFDDIRPFIRGASLFNWTWDNADFTVASTVGFSRYFRVRSSSTVRTAYII